MTSPSADTGIARWPLPDGREAMLRPIAPADFAIESAFLDGLSPAAGYNRLFSARHPGADEIRRWTDVDPARERAFVVTSTRAGDEFMLAVGRTVRDEAGPDAEFALLVGDAWAHQGIGRRLLAALIAAARADGVHTLYGTTLSTNVAMLALGHGSGFSARRQTGDATVTRLALSLGE
jgi:acetyltransferase